MHSSVYLLACVEILSRYISSTRGSSNSRFNTVFRYIKDVFRCISLFEVYLPYEIKISNFLNRQKI